MPDGPWEEVSLDFFGPFHNGKYLLVLVDDYSRYPVVKQVNSTSARTIIPILTEIFASFGVPFKLRSDNGPPFNGKEFKNFSEQEGFTHRKITPYWPRANGICERFMKNMGKVLRNASMAGVSFENELTDFLRNYRAVPHSSTNTPPNALMFRTRTTTVKMPILDKFKDEEVDLRAKKVDQESKVKMKEYNDLKLKTKTVKLNIGDLVLAMNMNRTKSIPIFDPIPYRIVEIKGSMITAKRGEQTITRNISFFKKVTDNHGGIVATRWIEPDEVAQKTLFDDNIPETKDNDVDSSLSEIE